MSECRAVASGANTSSFLCCQEFLASRFRAQSETDGDLVNQRQLIRGYGGGAPEQSPRLRYGYRIRLKVHARHLTLSESASSPRGVSLDHHASRRDINIHLLALSRKQDSDPSSPNRHTGSQDESWRPARRRSIVRGHRAPPRVGRRAGPALHAASPETVRLPHLTTDVIRREGDFGTLPAHLPSFAGRERRFHWTRSPRR